MGFFTTVKAAGASNSLCSALPPAAILPNITLPVAAGTADRTDQVPRNALLQALAQPCPAVAKQSAAALVAVSDGSDYSCSAGFAEIQSGANATLQAIKIRAAFARIYWSGTGFYCEPTDFGADPF